MQADLKSNVIAHCAKASAYLDCGEDDKAKKEMDAAVKALTTEGPKRTRSRPTVAAGSVG